MVTRSPETTPEMKFASEPKVTGTPNNYTTNARQEPVSTIGETLVFDGQLSADEDLVIDGTVKGSIDQGKCCLTIRPKGRVHADVNATKIFVEGTMEGDLKATVSVTVRKSGVVSGTIVAPRVALEDGCTFNGSIQMKEPRSNV